MPSAKKFIRPSSIPGSRTLAREKLLQLFTAAEVSQADPRQLFPYVFPFNFRMETPPPPNRPLRPEEIAALESDIKIEWRKEDLQFAHQFIDAYQRLQHQVIELIERFARQWSYERLAVLDRVILRMGVTEFLAFPDIPPEVTINEAIELAKKFSTDKSSTFINGLLDAILHHLKAEQLLQKNQRRKA